MDFEYTDENLGHSAWTQNFWFHTEPSFQMQLKYFHKKNVYLKVGNWNHVSRTISESFKNKHTFKASV